ncbi:MAG: CAP domain-containing protein [Herpetosiphonaceae bacterium]|nr:CAP domain-containing protein [Herpetosiphonaceae bacterium]
MPRRSCCALIGLIVLLAITPAAHSAPNLIRCFPMVPSIGDCLQGRFAQYWAANGGLSVFGYPTTPLFDANTGDVQAQMLERNRVEYHPDLAPPYDILLGRLGEDLLIKHGRNWRAEPLGIPQAGCWWVDTTHHAVCDQAPTAGFLSYYRSHGLDLGDPGVSERESLALFGYPLTEPRPETNATGDTVLTQWFERARFEWHPELSEPYRVLLGLLGREAWGNAPPPPPSQRPAPASIPDVNITPTTAGTAPSTPSATPTMTTIAATPSASPTALANDDQALIDRMAGLVDTLHQQAGCAPFKRDVRLDQAAQGHADDIALHQRIDHIGTDGATLRQRLDRVGYPYGSSASESIGVWNAPEDVVHNWMDEPSDGPHRLNITNCQYTDNGFGLGYSVDGRHWWVMDISSERQ